MRILLSAVLMFLFATTAVRAVAQQDQEVDAGSCRLRVSPSMYSLIQKGHRLDWTGPCEAGYAQGVGTYQRYEPTGRLAFVGKYEMNEGRIVAQHGVFYVNTGGAITGTGGVPISAQDVPDWARKIIAAANSPSTLAQASRASSASEASSRGALQLASTAAFCQSLIAVRNELAQFERQTKSEKNPLKRDSADERYRARFREVDQALDRSANGAQATNWTGKVTSFDFVRYSNGPAANVSIAIPCSVPISIHVRFFDWDGNPHTKHQYAPLSRWKPFLENLAVGDSVVFSVRFYLPISGVVWFNPKVDIPGAITDIRKGQ